MGDPRGRPRSAASCTSYWSLRTIRAYSHIGSCAVRRESDGRGIYRDTSPGRYLPASALSQGEKQACEEQEDSHDDDQPGGPGLTQGGLLQTMSKRSVLTCWNGTPTSVSASSMASIMAEEAQMRHS
jgi:hypothetical protein